MTWSILSLFSDCWPFFWLQKDKSCKDDKNEKQKVRSAQNSSESGKCNFPWEHNYTQKSIDFLSSNEIKD